MKKVIAALTLLIGLGGTSQAQEKIDFENIFNTQYTSVGIPMSGRVVIHSFNGSKWAAGDTLKIPVNCIAIDGNISRVLFLLSDRVIIDENYNCHDLCNKDTLVFDQQFEAVAAQNWLRNTLSTEAEYGYLKGEKNIAVYKDGDEWFVSGVLNPGIFKENRTVPLLTTSMPHSKIYQYGQSMYLMALNNKKVRFYRYESAIAQINMESVSPDKMNFDLPGDVITVFVYNDTKLGWVYRDRVEFYEFNKDTGQWQQSLKITALYF